MGSAWGVLIRTAQADGAIYTCSYLGGFHVLDSCVPLLQPPHTKLLVVKLQSCSDEELISTLQDITVWKYGKVCSEVAL